MIFLVPKLMRGNKENRLSPLPWGERVRVRGTSGLIRFPLSLSPSSGLRPPSPQGRRDVSELFGCGHFAPSVSWFLLLRELMITIVDYGMGNLRSVQKAFQKLGVEASISHSAQEMAHAEKLVLPGVGAFRDAIRELKTKDLVSPVKDHIASGKPFLGICLGMQLLFDVSYEDGEWEGLGIVPGDVQRLKDFPELKIPHMGWNSLQIQDSPAVFQDIPSGSHFYFVHSYHVSP